MYSEKTTLLSLRPDISIMEPIFQTGSSIKNVQLWLFILGEGKNFLNDSLLLIYIYIYIYIYVCVCVCDE